LKVILNEYGAASAQGKAAFKSGAKDFYFGWWWVVMFVENY